MNNFSHTPVLLREVLDALDIRSGAHYVDCTFGGGGYSQAIVEKGGKVLGLDVDQDAIAAFTPRDGIKLVRSNFERIEDVVLAEQFQPVAGVVFDLGVSSYQLDTAERGFSFLREGALDMRMDSSLSITAGYLLDVLDTKSLAELFLKFSDEMHSWKIARAIVAAREEEGTQTGNVSHPIIYWEGKSTTDFAEFVAQVVGGRKERIHPATRVFQALRMAVNDELGSLERGLHGAFEILESGGRIAVVSFHSIEDRVVKQFMSEYQEDHRGKIIGDVVQPGEEEISRNPRSRSGKLRVFQKN